MSVLQVLAVSSVLTEGFSKTQKQRVKIRWPSTMTSGPHLRKTLVQGISAPGWRRNLRTGLLGFPVGVFAGAGAILQGKEAMVANHIGSPQLRSLRHWPGHQCWPAARVPSCAWDMAGTAVAAAAAAAASPTPGSTERTERRNSSFLHV